MQDRRLRRFAMALAAAGTIACADMAHAETIELKLSHFIPPNHTFHKWALMWAQQLEKESGGQLKVTIYPNGQLVGPPNRQFDAARNGITDIAFTLHGVTPGRYAMTELANLPFTWPKAGSGSSVTGPRMTELANYLAPEHQGLHILYMSVANPVVFYSKVPIRKIEDFKGLKIRYAGVQNKFLIDALGGVPLPVPPPESQDALAKGIVEVAMFPHEAGVAYDLGSVVKYATEPPAATATFALVMNAAKYDALPPNLKALIDKTTGVAGSKQFGTMWEEAEKSGRALLISKGLEIVTLPDSDVGKMKQLMAPHVEAAIAALEKDGKPARKFYTEYTK